MSRFRFVWLAALLVGCGQLPNPNDLDSVAPQDSASAAFRRLEAVEATLQFKVEHGEITDEKRNDLIREVASEMLKKVRKESVPDSDQWMYASLLRVTNQWQEAEAALKIAVKVAPDDDRVVNDSLKLAQAQAKNGEVSEAIKTADSVMGANDLEVAPILVSILYEVVPAAQGKGHDAELATLLQKAIDCQRRAKVDMNTDEGKAFRFASKYHISKAMQKISELSAKKG